jgi:hypothetical protein
MRILAVPLYGIGLAAALCGLQPLRAQAAPEAAPENAPEAAAAAAPAIDPASIQLPDLHFTPDDHAIDNFEKYFFFNRADTGFATAYADLQECDGYARGLSYRTGYTAVPYPYAGTVGGIIGGVVVGVMDDAIYGSAERRRLRRVNMRTCMGFKGYTAFGLPKAIWEQFNFEEGNAHVEEGRRQRFLQMQARAASGPRPAVGEMHNDF